MNRLRVELLAASNLLSDVQPISAVMGSGLGDKVALMTDGRFSSGSHGFIIGHVTPEAQEGGPISLLRDGDQSTIDADKNVINVALSDDELTARRQSWTAPAMKAERGTLGCTSAR